jgi:chemotaxis protein MotB
MSEYPQIIIIKRRGGHEEEHHGGAWKIAFADFMTAMMAFFLVLWIINATDKNTKTIIARYFNPVKLENAAKSPKGIHGGAQPTKSSDKDSAGDAPDPNGDSPAKGASDNPESPAKTSKMEGHDKSAPAAAPPAPVDPAAPAATMSESQLFSDPYRSLDKIAGAQPQPAPTNEPAADGFRDPFRPIGLEPGGGVAALPPSAPIPPPAPTVVAPQAAPPVQSPGAPANASETAATPGATQLLAELRQKIGASGSAGPTPAVDVRMTDEGLLISLTDELSFAMFAVGSAEPQAKVVQAMQAIALSLRARPGAIVVRGHTDGRPYKSATYDNWRLSSARAQMVYYMLTRAGVPEGRFERIEGYADRRLRDPEHPAAAENRRIEILLREAKP